MLSRTMFGQASLTLPVELLSLVSFCLDFDPNDLHLILDFRE